MIIWLNLALEFLKLLPSLLEIKTQRTKIRDSVHDIYTVLLYILNNTASDRVLILYTTELKEGKNIYSTVEFEVNTANIKPVRLRWQRQKADNVYKDLITELVEKQELTILSKDLVKSDIQNSYGADGIEKSKWFAISKPKKTFWLITISYKKEVVLSSKEFDAIRYGLNELEKMFAKKK